MSKHNDHQERPAYRADQIKPLAGHVFVELDTKPEKVGGLVLPDSVKQRQQDRFGTILAVGPNLNQARRDDMAARIMQGFLSEHKGATMLLAHMAAPELAERAVQAADALLAKLDENVPALVPRTRVCVNFFEGMNVTLDMMDAQERYKLLPAGNVKAIIGT